VAKAVETSFSDLWSQVDHALGQIETAAESLPAKAQMNNLTNVTSTARTVRDNASAIGGYVREFRRMGAIFFEGDLIDLRRLYGLVEVHRRKLLGLAESVSSASRIDGPLMKLIDELSSLALGFRSRGETLHTFVIQLFAKIKGKIRPPPTDDYFLRSTVTQREFLECVLSMLDHAEKGAKIASQSIDRIHQVLLTNIIKARAITMKLLLGKPELKDGKVLEELRQFAANTGNLEIRQNYGLHGRLCVIDDKYAIVSSCDLVYDTHSWHYDAGVATLRMVGQVSTYFDDIWQHSVGLDSIEKPIPGETKLIVHYDKSQKKPAEIVDEINEGLVHRDKWVRFRTSHVEGIGYVDSILTAEEAVSLLRDVGPVFLNTVIPIREIRRIKDHDDFANAISNFAKQEFTDSVSVFPRFERLSKSTALKDSDQNIESIIRTILVKEGRAVGLNSVPNDYELHVYLYGEELVLGYCRGR
jgi:hypothetical protein